MRRSVTDRLHELVAGESVAELRANHLELAVEVVGRLLVTVHHLEGKGGYA